MKRFLIIALIALGVLGAIFAYRYRAKLGLARAHTVGGSEPSESQENTSSTRPANIDWQKIDRSGDGFKVEMPEDPKPLQVPASNESGVSEPVNMIFSSPDGNTTYAVAWSDNPPVMRVANRAADTTLDMARDGALARTQTRLLNESRSTPLGFPGRDIVARNVGGGILDSRLIFDGQRLYMLIACFPSMSARREQDVTRFFNSFQVKEPARIPQTLPLATVVARRD